MIHNEGLTEVSKASWFDCQYLDCSTITVEQAQKLVIPAIGISFAKNVKNKQQIFPKRFMFDVTLSACLNIPSYT